MTERAVSCRPPDICWGTAGRPAATWLGVLAFVALLAAGCTFNRPLLEISPQSRTYEKFHHSAAVVLNDETCTWVETAHPSGIRGSAHRFRFAVGERLCAALAQAVAAAYDSVARLAASPVRGAYDRVFEFTIAGTELDITVTEGLLIDSEHAGYVVAVNMLALDGASMANVRWSRIQAGGVSGTKFEAAVEEGVQALADNVATVIAAGFGEPPAAPERSGAPPLPR